MAKCDNITYNIYLFFFFLQALNVIIAGYTPDATDHARRRNGPSLSTVNVEAARHQDVD